MKLTATITRLPSYDASGRSRFSIGYVTDTGVSEPKYCIHVAMSESTARRRMARLQKDFDNGFVPMALNGIEVKERGNLPGCV